MLILPIGWLSLCRFVVFEFLRCACFCVELLIALFAFWLVCVVFICIMFSWCVECFLTTYHEELLWPVTYVDFVETGCFDLWLFTVTFSSWFRLCVYGCICWFLGFVVGWFLCLLVFGFGLDLLVLNWLGLYIVVALCVAFWVVVCYLRYGRLLVYFGGLFCDVCLAGLK